MIDFEKIFKKSGNDVNKAYSLLLKQIKSSRLTDYCMYDEDINAIINSKLSSEDKIILFNRILTEVDAIHVTEVEWQQFLSKISNRLIVNRHIIDDETLEEFGNFLRYTICLYPWYFLAKENGCNALLKINEVINVFEKYSYFSRVNIFLKTLYTEIMRIVFVNIKDEIIENAKEHNVALLENNYSKINSSDYDNRTLLFLIQEISFSPTEFVEIIYKLLEAGVDPNNLDTEGNTFLTYLINSFKYENEEINEILLMIIPMLAKCNYEFNYPPTIFKALLNTDKINDKLYRALRDNGYDSSKEIFKVEELNNKNNEVKNYILYRIIINKLINFIECNDGKVDTQVKEQLFNIEDDLYGLMEIILMYYKYDTGRIALNWKQEMINHRFESVNVIDGPFTAAEAINGLKMVFNDINNEVEEEVEKVKSKCLNYENN